MPVFKTGAFNRSAKLPDDSDTLQQIAGFAPANLKVTLRRNKIAGCGFGQPEGYPAPQQATAWRVVKTGAFNRSAKLPKECA